MHTETAALAAARHSEAAAALASWLAVDPAGVYLVPLDPYGWSFRSVSHKPWGVDQGVPVREG